MTTILQMRKSGTQGVKKLPKVTRQVSDEPGTCAQGGRALKRTLLNPTLHYAPSKDEELAGFMEEK